MADLVDEILDVLKRHDAPMTKNVTDMVDELVELVEDEIEEREEELALRDEDEDDD